MMKYRKDENINFIAENLSKHYCGQVAKAQQY